MSFFIAGFAFCTFCFCCGLPTCGGAVLVTCLVLVLGTAGAGPPAMATRAREEHRAAPPSCSALQLEHAATMRTSARHIRNLSPGGEKG